MFILSCFCIFFLFLLNVHVKKCQFIWSVNFKFFFSLFHLYFKLYTNFSFCPCHSVHTFFPLLLLFTFRLNKNHEQSLVYLHISHNFFFHSFISFGVHIFVRNILLIKTSRQVFVHVFSLSNLSVVLLFTKYSEHNEKFIKNMNLL